MTSAGRCCDRPPLLTLPTSSFFLPSTLITGCPAARCASAWALMWENWAGRRLAGLQQPGQFRRRLDVGASQLTQGHVQPLDVDLPHVAQPKMSQTRAEVELDVRAVPAARRRPKTRLAVEPLVEIGADGLPAGLHMSSSVQLAEGVVQGLAGVPLGCEATLPDLPALPELIGRELVCVEPRAVTLRAVHPPALPVAQSTARAALERVSLHLLTRCMGGPDSRVGVASLNSTPRGLGMQSSSSMGAVGMRMRRPSR